MISRWTGSLDVTLRWTWIPRLFQFGVNWPNCGRLFVAILRLISTDWFVCIRFRIIRACIFNLSSKKYDGEFNLEAMEILENNFSFLERDESSSLKRIPRRLWIFHRWYLKGSKGCSVKSSFFWYLSLIHWSSRWSFVSRDR